MFKPKKNPPALDPDMTVDEIMRRWPQTVPLVMKSGMLCVGCPIGAFHTVSEACAEHEIDEATFVRELTALIGG